MRTRQLLLVVPLAGLLGVVAALSLYYVADRSSSKLPSFQAELAKRSSTGSVASHSPTTSAAERRAKLLERSRVRRARIRQARARAAAARAAQAAAAAVATTAASASTPATDATADFQASQPQAPALSKPAPAPAPRPAPAPAPKKRSGGGGGGGGSFDDSG